MLGAEEMPARPDLPHRVESERVLVDDDRIEERLDHPEQLGIEDHLLEPRVEPALHPAGAMHQQVDAAHDRAPQREDRLVGRLGVDRVGRRHV